MNLERWLAAVGKGPAREACVQAVRQFAQAFSEEEAGPTPGFAWEGLAAGLVLRGREQRLAEVMRDASPTQRLFLRVGVGFARSVQGLEPRAPMEADGAGFAAGVLRPRWALDRGARPALDGDLQGWFDHGLGRAIWYVCAGSAVPMARVVRGLALERRANLWQGIGVASAFTGGAGPAELRKLMARCDDADALQQGASWAHSLRPMGLDDAAIVLPDGPVAPGGLYLEGSLGRG